VIAAGPVVRAAAVALLAVAVAGLGGCTSTQPIRARIVDADQHPLPGALLYAEAYLPQRGAFDFVAARAGRDGEVPAAGSAPLKIAWRHGARLALAAFAPGKKPVVLDDPLGRVRADGLTLTLEELPPPGRRWEPRLAHLSFPHEHSPELAARAAAPAYAALRRAFLAAYAPLIDGEESAVPREWEKIEVLRALDRGPAGSRRDR